VAGDIRKRVICIMYSSSHTHVRIPHDPACSDTAYPVDIAELMFAIFYTTQRCETNSASCKLVRDTVVQWIYTLAQKRESSCLSVSIIDQSIRFAYPYAVSRCFHSVLTQAGWSPTCTSLCLLITIVQLYEKLVSISLKCYQFLVYFLFL